MTPREPDRFEAKAYEARMRCEHEPLICGACLAAESSALERAAQECDAHAEYFAAQRIRALIPPAVAPETQRDVPCGGCGHPLWWHQWSSRERFCSKPLNERDFCRCKSYQEPAAAPAEETCPQGCDKPAGHEPPCGEYAPAAETGKAQAWADAIEYCEEMFSPGWLADPRNRGIFAARIYKMLNAARVAPPKGEEVDGTS